MTSIPKVTIIGAGNVGATAAQRIIDRDLADVVLLDRKEDFAKGKALDIGQASALELRNRTIIGTGSYEDTKESTIVVITAGLPRKPGQSRDDLLKANGDIVSEVTEKVVQYSPNCILIIVSNPVDVMTHLAWIKSKLPKEKVMGMAGVLDSARMKYFIAKALGVSPDKVETMVLGGHGDQMVPIPRLSTVSGEPVTKLLTPEKILAICERTRKGGGEIVDLLGTSSYYGAGSAITNMVEAILQDKDKEAIPVAAHLDGQYGLKDVFVGIPVNLGKDGVEEVIELQLAPEELAALKASAELVKQNVGKLTELALV